MEPTASAALIEATRLERLDVLDVIDSCSSHNAILIFFLGRVFLDQRRYLFKELLNLFDFDAWFYQDAFPVLLGNR